MDSLDIEIQLCSETVFGSGQALPGYVDLEIVHDDKGIPYLKGKTFKGKLREEIEAISEKMKIINPEINLKSYISKMFGEEGEDNLTSIKFSDCTLYPKVIEGIDYGLKKKLFTQEEVLESLTDVRYFTKINDEGIAEDGSLRQFRVINKGITFICRLYTDRELEDIEKEILSSAAAALRHLGAMESRGKGEIRCRLLQNGKDVTDFYLNTFKKKVLKVG